jgi:hypothetical protein
MRLSDFFLFGLVKQQLMGKQFVMEADKKQAITPWLEQRDRKLCSKHYTQLMSKQYLDSIHVQCSRSTLTGAIAASGMFYKFFMLATRVRYMQLFVYPHRKNSKDAILGDPVSERLDHRDQSITMGNDKRCINNCNMLIKKCIHKLWCGGAPSCWKNTAGCKPCNYTWISFSAHPSNWDMSHLL